MFIAKTLYKWPETGTGGLNRPPGDWRFKKQGGWKFSRGFDLPTALQLAHCQTLFFHNSPCVK